MSYALLAIARFLWALGHEQCSLSCSGARGYEQGSPRRRIFFGHWGTSDALSAAAACGGMSKTLLVVGFFLWALGHERCSLSCGGARGYERCSPRRRIFSFFLGTEQSPVPVSGAGYGLPLQRAAADARYARCLTVTETIQRRCPAGLFARNVNWADQRVAGLAKSRRTKCVIVEAA